MSAPDGRAADAAPLGWSRDDLAAWLRLLETPGIGRVGARQLLRAFGTPAGVFDAKPTAWREVVDGAAAAALARAPEDLNARLDDTWGWLCGGADRHIIVLGDAQYPAALLATPDPPLLLYAIGQLSHLNAPALAIVGSRNASAQGLENARQFASALSDAGLVVVSGLAAGIDAAAHEGALRGRSGTIAVVGTGLDRVYPRQHHELAHRIAAQGVLLSEFTIGMPPLQVNFPQRNRIIAGLGLGTLVVEAALASGSLITARQAADCGRDVFAIPGSIHLPTARGCHALIKQGAKLVEDTGDILAELHIPHATSNAPAAAFEPDAGGGDPVLAAMSFDPVTLDALLARTGWPASELSERLLSLEMEGHVARLPGQLFQRVARA